MTFHLFKLKWKCLKMAVIMAWPQCVKESTLAVICDASTSSVWAKIEKIISYLQVPSWGGPTTLHWCHISYRVSQITSDSTVCSTICSGVHQRKHQSFALLALCEGNHQWPVDSPHKGPVAWKRFPCNDIIMLSWVPYNSWLWTHIWSIHIWWKYYLVLIQLPT